MILGIGKKKKEKKEEKEEKAEIVKEMAQTVRRPGNLLLTGVLRAPHITEKASQASSRSQYVFRISNRANKIDVKRAVEAKYGVNVQSVNIVNLPGKERRRGRQIGWKAGHRKAVVRVKEGQKIEIQ